MSLTTPELDDPELLGTAWDLDPLVDGAGAAGADRLLDDAQSRAQTFAEQHSGRVAELGPAGLVAAMHELAVIEELVGRAGTYAGLRFSENTADPEHGALLQKVEERATAIGTTLLFFELEWAALDDGKAEELLGADGLDFARHHLRTARRYRPHLLTEPEETILTEKAVTGRSAWARLFEEQIAAIDVDLGDAAPEPIPLEVALSRLLLPDRDARRTTAEAVTRSLSVNLRTRAFILNTLAADKATDDRLRHYPHWLSARNLSNEASDESVAALIEAVRNRYEVARRWYRLKARLLGLPRLADYDRSAAISADEVTFGWSESRDLVLDCYASFSTELGDLARQFFEERWIDAPVRPGKRPGAFCSGGVPSQHPYVLLNYTARRRDVLTLAHELGHGVHFALARRQGVFQQGTPLTLAEMASVFGETIVFGRLLDQEHDPARRLALLAENVEGAIATVFRQVAMNRFEDLVHTQRREQGELSVDRLGELWARSQEEFFGDAVEVTEGYRSWWSYIPHFINTPGYVYAYAYGQLLALSAYQRYREIGEDFVPSYLELLASGGSRSPEELGAIIGVDLADPGFWDAGLGLVEQQLAEAEEAAQASGRLD